MTGHIKSDEAEFYIAREFRRCVQLMLVACALTGGSSLLLAVRFGHQPDLGDVLFMGAFACLAISNVVLTQQWRVRLNATGIRRRRLFGWDEWTWEEFQEGRIHKGWLPYSFCDPTRPRWRRTLHFMLLNWQKREHVVESCRHLWTPPPTPAVPDCIAVRLPKGMSLFTKLIRFDGEGIHVERRGHVDSYPWAAVREVRIRRVEHARRDFQEMNLELSDRKLKFLATRFFDIPNQNWTGPGAENLMDLVLSKAPASRVSEVASHGPPTGRDEVHNRLAKLKNQDRHAIVGYWMALLPTLTGFVFMNSFLLRLAKNIKMPGQAAWNQQQWIWIAEFAVITLLCLLSTIAVMSAIARVSKTLRRFERLALQHWLVENDAIESDFATITSEKQVLS